jgi:hypothetical protein
MCGAANSEVGRQGIQRIALERSQSACDGTSHPLAHCPPFRQWSTVSQVGEGEARPAPPSIYASSSGCSGIMTQFQLRVITRRMSTFGGCSWRYEA